MSLYIKFDFYWFLFIYLFIKQQESTLVPDGDDPSLIHLSSYDYGSTLEDDWLIIDHVSMITLNLTSQIIIQFEPFNCEDVYLIIRQNVPLGREQIYVGVLLRKNANWGRWLLVLWRWSSVLKDQVTQSTWLRPHQSVCDKRWLKFKGVVSSRSRQLLGLVVFWDIVPALKVVTMIHLIKTTGL